MTAQLVSSYRKALEHGDARRYEVVLLNFDQDEQAQADYMRKSGITFPSMKLARTEESAFARLAPAEALPTLVLLDAASGKEITREEAEIFRLLENNG